MIKKERKEEEDEEENKQFMLIITKKRRCIHYTQFQELWDGWNNFINEDSL
jgi:hypothetical protein